MNGAGIGMEAFRLRLGLLVHRRAVSESYEAVLGVAMPTTARLLAVTTTTRAFATRTMASALFAPRSSTLGVAV